VGGKLTGYRAIAEEAVDLVCDKVGSHAKAVTAERALPGGGARPEGGDAGLAHLAALYGSRAADVAALASAQRGLGDRLASAYPDIAAQAIWAAREEQCARLTDFLLRRTRLGFSADQGIGAAAPAAAMLASELGWSAARLESELAAYEAYVATTQAFRRE
jgi:glycerol-3-phosphate dehydrogenase